MQSTGAKVALAVGAIAVIVVLFVVLQGDDDSNNGTTTTTATTATTQTTTKPSKPAEPKTPTVAIDSNGDPVGGVRKLSFDSGDQIQFKVKSKIDDAVHVHGYDVEKDVPAGKTVTFSFPAKLEGVFEVESHTTETQLAELRVNP